MKLTLEQLYHKMHQAIGPSGWWPADSKAEIIMGAILIQNTNWRNADRALAQLRQATHLNPDDLLTLSQTDLQALIRPAGFYQNKAKALISVFSWLRQFQYDYAAINHHFGHDLRKKLRELHGVGDETADVMLTYIFERPTFISDKYARTLFTCLGITGLTNYQSLARICQLPPSFDAAMAQDFHGLIDEFGKQFLHPVTNFEQSFLAGDYLELN
ncbi:endonuclease III domain-containing protein [Lactobacillus sp. 3B(2020)]|uniref:endonuclease III domain-containing protein n=2 Tax=Lactobacillaceae TaxID=33958 RepID=UPI0015E04CF0|nr:deoxyribonuclease I [Lactobacillus sp. 3B(2020)]QLL69120.1 deoxyribonuclease I [Lactobacillus sp. 3B(2020)]